MREVKDSWLVLQGAMHLFRIAAERLYQDDRLPKSEVEDVMDVIHGSIKGTIVGKHPKALPEGFHESVITFGEQMLSMHARTAGGCSPSDLYERYVRSLDDALIPETADNITVATALWRTSGHSVRTQARLLSTSWSFQLAKSFVRSDIMDVRGVGIGLLKSRLVDIYNTTRNSPEGFENPITQYAVRFLRENEITAYIFGPESHAGLINQSHDIVAFLAATGTLTNVEIDIVWRTCCTSVEADFVKAAFAALAKAAEFMDIRGLLYLAAKYTSIPTTKLSSPALNLLPECFRQLEKRTGNLAGEAARLECVMTAIAILRHADTGELSPSTHSLRQIALTEVAQLADRKYSLEERTKVYKHVLPEVFQSSQYATSSMDILSVYMSRGIGTDEALVIVDMLPITAAVDELCEFITKASQSSRLRLESVTVRLECILSLVALTAGQLAPSLEQRLFAHVFATPDTNSDIRNVLWDKLHAMAITGTGGLKVIAARMWSNFMQDHVPSLSEELAIPSVVNFIVLALKDELSAGRDRSELVEVLRLPLWTTLARFATRAPLPAVNDAAKKGIIELLFAVPVALDVPVTAISKCLKEFVEGHIDELRQTFESLSRTDEEAKKREYAHAIDLLNWVLIRSKECQHYLQPNTDSDVLVIEEVDNATESLSFKVHAYCPDVRPKTVPVVATATTSVSRLQLILSTALGADHVKMIVDGFDITAASDRSLADAGVRQSGVIQACPRFRPDSDIEKAFARAGPVEEAILAHYSAIDAFLDGPSSAAEKVSNTW